MKKLTLMKLCELDDLQKNKVEKFIAESWTNGEFINSLTFLGYHPKNRFHDDSIIIIDEGSKSIEGLMLCAQDTDNKAKIVSHPGTTFAGPVVNFKNSVTDIKNILDLAIGYYEDRYECVEIRCAPQIYAKQPSDIIEYFLLKKGFNYNMMGLANVINIKEVNTIEDALLIFARERRTDYRKSLKSEMTFFKCDSVIKSIWDNMNMELAKKYDAATTHTYEEINTLMRLCPKNIETFQVNVNGHYGALSIVFKFKNVFHTQYLGLNSLYRKDHPNVFLIANLMLEARKQGYEWFSFGSSTEERGRYLNESLYKYKAAYGGGSVILPVYTKII